MHVAQKSIFDRTGIISVCRIEECEIAENSGFSEGFRVVLKEEEPSDSLSDGSVLVEHRGFEPLTSTMRTLRAGNCSNLW